MQIDDTLISKLEGLAKLKFAEQDRVKIIKDLEKIFDMINVLENADTTNVKPLVYMNDTPDSTRSDEVNNQLPKKKALDNAPEHNHNFITIPKVIDL